jgi:hypothetical protein
VCIPSRKAVARRRKVVSRFICPEVQKPKNVCNILIVRKYFRVFLLRRGWSADKKCPIVGHSGRKEVSYADYSVTDYLAAYQMCVSKDEVNAEKTTGTLAGM